MDELRRVDECSRGDLAKREEEERLWRLARCGEDEERDDEHRSALCLRHLQDFTDDVIIT